MTGSPPSANVVDVSAAGAPSECLGHRPNANTATDYEASVKAGLHDVFGHRHFRPGQHAVIESILARHNTLAIMPTGSGKSLCYQLPALALPGMTVVVSPLIALMKDQVDKLGSADVSAEELNSSLSAREQAAALNAIARAGTEFVFTTPERLTDPQFLETLQRQLIDLFVIDEAHCISQWGHDFRPAYLGLREAIHAMGNPPVLALTATATEPVIDDIKERLGLPDMRVFNTGIYRPNLFYAVEQYTNEVEKTQAAISLVTRTRGSGIVYAATIKAVESMRQHLAAAGESVTCYHGKLSSRARAANQEAFMEGRTRVMVATNAFGMGVDKSDLRFVFHLQMPANLETYYQESGRAGRDGLPAQCTLLYLGQDKRVQQYFLAHRFPDVSEFQAIRRGLRQSHAMSFVSLNLLHRTVARISKVRLEVALHALVEAGIIEQSDGHYRLIDGDVRRRDLIPLAERYQEKDRRDRAALDHMEFYARTGYCRWQVLLDHFHEHAPFEHCGHCDNCRRLARVEGAPATSMSTEQPKKRAAPPLASGDRVDVSRYGEGIVTRVEGEKSTVQFPDGSERVFLTRRLKVIDAA